MWRIQYNIFDALLFQISFAVNGLACVILNFDIAYDAILLYWYLSKTCVPIVWAITVCVLNFANYIISLFMYFMSYLNVLCDFVTFSNILVQHACVCSSYGGAMGLHMCIYIDIFICTCYMFIVLLCGIVFCLAIYILSTCNAIVCLYENYSTRMQHIVSFCNSSAASLLLCHIMLWLYAINSSYHLRSAINSLIYFHDIFWVFFGSNDLTMTPSSPAISMLTCLYFQVQHDRCVAFRLWQTCQEDAPQQGGDLEVMWCRSKWFAC